MYIVVVKNGDTNELKTFYIKADTKEEAMEQAKEIVSGDWSIISLNEKKE